MPGPDPEHPRRDVTKVIELFGDYWHAEQFVGRTSEDHVSDLVNAFAEIGIACLVIWEKDVDTEATKLRVREFLTPTICDKSSIPVP